MFFFARFFLSIYAMDCEDNSCSRITSEDFLEYTMIPKKDLSSNQLKTSFECISEKIVEEPPLKFIEDDCYPCKEDLFESLLKEKDKKEECCIALSFKIFPQIDIYEPLYDTCQYSEKVLPKLISHLKVERYNEIEKNISNFLFFKDIKDFDAKKILFFLENAQIRLEKDSINYPDKCYFIIKSIMDYCLLGFDSNREKIIEEIYIFFKRLQGVFETEKIFSLENLREVLCNFMNKLYSFKEETISDFFKILGCILNENIILNYKNHNKIIQEGFDKTKQILIEDNDFFIKECKFINHYIIDMPLEFDLQTTLSSKIIIQNILHAVCEEKFKSNIKFLKCIDCFSEKYINEFCENKEKTLSNLNIALFSFFDSSYIKIKNEDNKKNILNILTAFSYALEWNIRINYFEEPIRIFNNFSEEVQLKVNSNGIEFYIQECHREKKHKNY